MFVVFAVILYNRVVFKASINHKYVCFDSYLLFVLYFSPHVGTVNLLTLLNLCLPEKAYFIRKQVSLHTDFT